MRMLLHKLLTVKTFVLSIFEVAKLDSHVQCQVIIPLPNRPTPKRQQQPATSSSYWLILHIIHEQKHIIHKMYQLPRHFGHVRAYI
ncbi:hypothetical protein AAHE18_10G048700 [Arachis hypogaea]